MSRKKKKKKNKKKKNNFINTLLKSIALILLVILLFFICLSITYIYMKTKSLNQQISNYEQNDTNDEIEISNRHLNFAIFGLDKDGTRTDVIIIGTIDAFDKSIDIISIYRDTYVELLESNKKKLQDHGYYVPASGKMKINHIRHYGQNFGLEMLVEQLEYDFDITLDYYAEISLDAFRFIIDEIGGVTYNVPQRMYYSDPYQNLYIDLYPGEQVLNGEQSEGLVRYRKGSNLSYGYSRGDLDRVDIQQDFLKAVIQQVLKKETIMNNLNGFLLTTLKYVDTNVNILNIGNILPYLLAFDINSVSINTYTLPVDEANIDNVSYVILKEGYKDIINSVFYDY